MEYFFYIDNYQFWILYNTNIYLNKNVLIDSLISNSDNCRRARKLKIKIILIIDFGKVRKVIIIIDYDIVK